MARPAVSRFLRGLRTLVLVLPTLVLSGCSDSQSSSAKGENSAADQIAPEELLAKLRTTYAELDSYSDNALVLERGVSRSRGTISEIPYTQMSLQFERPNRYAVSYDFGVASNEGRTSYRIFSDGKRVRSTANELPEQVHEAIAPVQATVENFIPEPELRMAMQSVSLENLFPQLLMLLASDPEPPIFPGATAMEMLPVENIKQSPCYRLSLVEPQGKRILWIDKEKLILRRMEIPIEKDQDLQNPTRQFTSFSVDVDFDDVALNPELDGAVFSIAVPEKGRLIRRFVPPPPAGPSTDLGKPIKQFSFTDAQGAKFTPASLQGKVTVLDFWASDCAPCKEHTPHLEKAFQEFKSSEDVVFYGVSTDPNGLATETVEKTLHSWGATFPLLRDFDKNSFYNLDVKATPTLMLVSADGRLQAVRQGPLETADQLVEKIRQVQAGEDLPDQARKEHAKSLDQYQAILAAATIKGSLVDEKTSPADIAPRKMPEKLQVKELWQTKLADIGKPGDVVVLPAFRGEPQEIVVLDGSGGVVRFDSQGKKLTRIELPNHPEKDGGFLRSAIDAEGSRWFLVSGVGWQKVYLYDKDWKLVFAFPDEVHSGVGDAQLFDLKSSGSPSLLVGYWGGRGVQAGSLTGERLWVNRHLDHVLQVSAGPTVDSKDQSLWCTSTRGTVFEMTADGKANKEIVVVGYTMISVESPASDEPTRCGLTLIEPGKYAVVAFDEEGQVAWHYGLPEGEYSGEVPKIQRINLPAQENCLLITGPDGSLHFLSSTGELIDRFDYGKAITGLATLSTDDGTFLWVSAGDRCTAWQIRAEAAP